MGPTFNYRDTKIGNYLIRKAVWHTVGATSPPAPPPDPPAPPADPPAPPADPPKPDEQPPALKAALEKNEEMRQALESARTDLQALGSKQELTAAQKVTLEKTIDTLTGQLHTKEQLQETALENLRNETKIKIESLETQSKKWQGQFESSTIASEILKASSQPDKKIKAHNNAQILTILSPDARLVEQIDEKTKEGTGKFEVRIKLASKDKDGNPTELDLSPAAAVQHLAEQRENANLFEGKGVGGSGDMPDGDGKATDIAELAKDPAAYKKARQEGRVPGFEKT
jgi:hypothetical protein